MTARYQRRESGSILTMLKRIGRSDCDNELFGETQRIKQLITDIGIPQYAKQSFCFSHKSIQSLITALSEVSKSLETNLDQAVIYISCCIHIASQIASANSQVMQPLWSQTFGFFFSCLSLAAQTNSGRLMNSLVLNSLFVLMNEL